MIAKLFVELQRSDCLHAWPFACALLFPGVDDPVAGKAAAIAATTAARHALFRSTGTS
jgi:hypothetical protein